MPRGKYVNHKGRSRHFSSPEELKRQLEKDEAAETSTEDELNDEDGAVGGKSRSKSKKTPDKIANGNGEPSSDDDDDDEEEEEEHGKKKGIEALIEVENPNRGVRRAAQKLGNLSLNGTGKPELSRREREQLERQKARLRYERLHDAGKTLEAKEDLARLALVRQQRAEAAAKREAEKKAAEERKLKKK